MQSAVVSVEKLAGGSVFNRAGESLGKIEDFMIDIESGCVRYAVVSVRGLLGVGHKLFAVPPEALTVDADTQRVLLDVDAERFKNAPGFDRDNWPDFADPSFGRNVYGFYGRKPYWM